MLNRRSVLFGLAALATPARAGDQVPGTPSLADGSSETIRTPDVLPIELVSRLPIEGNPNATITIVEFSDFQCRYCAKTHATMAELLEKFPNELRYQYRQFPFDWSPVSPVAARYYEAIASIDKDAATKFRVMVYADQKSLNRDGAKFLDKSVEVIGLEAERVRTLSKSSEIQALVAQDIALATARNVTGTPNFILSGPRDGAETATLVKGAYPVETFESLVNLFLGRPTDAHWVD